MLGDYIKTIIEKILPTVNVEKYINLARDPFICGFLAGFDVSKRITLKDNIYDCKFEKIDIEDNE